MKLIIQIPCYNEEKNLHITINDLPKKIDGIDEIEILIINDGSSDKTVEIAKKIGVNHIVNFKRNKGLAYGFMAGIDACLHLGADIIVNTDADNQYCGEDIKKLVKPIVEGKTDIVIGERPINHTKHFSWLKKQFQHIGSFVVRKASNSTIPDAPSGFRAYSRDAALRLNVINQYTYTLETIIQAGHQRIAMMSVPIKTNAELRKSRLFKSMWGYMKISTGVIIRSFIMYRPIYFFGIIGTILFIAGLLLGIRFMILGFKGHVQSLILASILMLLGVQTIFMGLQADIIAANRKILEDIQYRIRKIDCSKKENLSDVETINK